MNRNIHIATKVFIAELWGKKVGFIGVLHYPSSHVKNFKKVSRVVVLPDYQGIGIGKVLLNFVGKYYTDRNFRLIITTSHPAFNKSLAKPWRLMRQGRVSHQKYGGLAATSSLSRLTCSWEYK